MKRTQKLLLLSAFLFPAFLFADGGAILSRRTINGLDITVFAAPAPLRAGPVDVSVLVRENSRPLLDAEVEIAWVAGAAASGAWMPPCCSMKDTDGRFPASRAHSQNQFLHSALVPVTTVGPSRFVIRVVHGTREALLSCEIVAAPPRPPALTYWPLLAFPPGLIAAFALHQILREKTHPPPR